MTDLNGRGWPDLLVVKHFLEPITCKQIMTEMTDAHGDAATVYGVAASGAVDQTVRRTLRLLPSIETVALVTRRLFEFKTTVEKHFGVALSECEDPQFLRYREGDFFVAHQDGNTGMLRLDSELRLVSTVIFLSDESDSPRPGAHCGGSLLFSDWRPGANAQKFRVIGEAGTLVAFRAETTHEVTPITHGERYSIVSWYR